MSSTISLTRFADTAAQIRAEYLQLLIPILDASQLTEKDAPNLTTTLKLEADSEGHAALVAVTVLTFAGVVATTSEQSKVVEELFAQMPALLVL